MATRPKLTLETVPEYLDWLTSNLGGHSRQDIEHHLRAAEMVVRLRMGDAQGKATQHTLVEEGIIDPPPTAS